jgi:hypothetical protein
MLKLISLLVVLLISSNAFSYEKLVYTMKKSFLAKAEMIFVIDDIIYENINRLSIESTTKLFVLGKLSKNIHHKSINKLDYSPILNVRCQWPNAKDEQFSCESNKYFNDGSFLYKAYDSSIADLQEIIEGSVGVTKMDPKDWYSEFSSGFDAIDDISSIMLLSRAIRNGFMKQDDIYYISIFGKILKVYLQISENKNNDGLYLSFKADENSPQILAAQLPTWMLYDKNLGVISEIYGKSLKGYEYTVKLSLKDSVISKK